MNATSQKPAIKLPWMETLADKVSESIESSTIGRAISGPSGGLTYFARKALPAMKPKLTVVYHRIFKENNALKQHQCLFASVAGPIKFRTDWWFHNNTMVGKRVVEALIERKVDLLILDGGEHLDESFNDIVAVIRQELREAVAKCGILILSRQHHHDVLNLGSVTDIKTYPMGFVFNTGKLDKTEVASIVAHWLVSDTTLKKRLVEGDPDTLEAISKIYGFTFGAFELLEDFVESFLSKFPEKNLTSQLVSETMRWKTSEL